MDQAVDRKKPTCRFLIRNGHPYCALQLPDLLTVHVVFLENTQEVPQVVVLCFLFTTTKGKKEMRIKKKVNTYQSSKKMKTKSKNINVCGHVLLTVLK